VTSTIHYSRTHIIGIDWAASDEAKCGLALAEARDGWIAKRRTRNGKGGSGSAKSRPAACRGARTRGKIQPSFVVYYLGTP
jgi:hypothetical protein